MHRRSALKTIILGTGMGIPAVLGKNLSPPALPSEPEIQPSERTAMAALAEDFRRKFNAPGLSVAIARNGRIAYQEAFGFTGPNSSEPLSTSNLFRIASVSKPITSATIFSLVESGRLRTDATVFGKLGILGTDYGKQPYRQGVEQITIDHLLTHSCGGWGNSSEDPMFSHLSMNHAELISWTLDNQPLKNSPGTAFAYSNFGYCILGRVIEKVTNRPYSGFVQATILSPSGIADMRIGGNTLKDRAPGEVTYYGQPAVAGENHYDDPYALNVSRMDSHGGWIATPTDLVNFAMHVDGFDASRNILKPEAIRSMVTPSKANPRYARGWNVNSAGHWWHGGDLGGTSAILVRTSSKFCWAALTNTRCAQIEEAIDDLLWDMAKKVTAWRPALG